MIRIETFEDAKLSETLEITLKRLLDEAFEGDFSEEDWNHSLNGTRFVGYMGDLVVAHGSVVKRKIWINEVEKLAGYIEAIAVLPSHWRLGIGSALMKEISQYCLENFDYCLLSTDEKSFYRRFGWKDFEGSSFVLSGEEEVSTQSENEGLMYLLGVDVEIHSITKVVCEERDGDAW